MPEIGAGSTLVLVFVAALLFGLLNDMESSQERLWSVPDEIGTLRAVIYTNLLLHFISYDNLSLSSCFLKNPDSAGSPPHNYA